MSKRICILELQLRRRNWSVKAAYRGAPGIATVPNRKHKHLLGAQKDWRAMFVPRKAANMRNRQSCLL